MSSKQKKPHVLCIPAPAQGHINPFLKLAKILNSKGFLITFVNTEFNHQRLLRSQGSDALSGFPTFSFETIPDGLPTPENLDASQEAVPLCKAIDELFLDPFRSLLTKLSASDSPVTYIVADAIMGFTLEAAKEMDIPEILFWTAGAASLLCFEQYPNLLDKGLMPLQDSSFLVNGYLDTIYDCIPSMPGIRLKDIPPFIRMSNPGDDYMVEFFCRQVERAKTASAIIFNTYHELESDIFGTLSSIFPPCYGIGPLNFLEKEIVHKSLASIKSNLWKEEIECLKWLDSKEPLSVIYVNFDLVIGDSAILPPEFLAETNNRGLLASWCPQEQVLNHQSIGGFLTHSGWNSTIESISSGVPMICWPFYSDQQPNCWMSCNKWGVAMDIDVNVKSDEVAETVIELMNGERGKETRKNAIKWKIKAEEACALPYGSSMVNMEKLIRMLQASP
ncbi:hypothetical protein OSB04_000963 [Centaurea solstitialis]|uniref:Glycosyltransferase n=1 Tax=Centaurea solstitialis TaxID=347529 RepID=A0AA38WLA0_9ASTR|nr:hypothetical protein OSB04_000963 [Centaurea solstitialis]